MASGARVVDIPTVQITTGSMRRPDDYPVGLAYDEMFVASGETRPHYQRLHTRIQTLGALELADQAARDRRVALAVCAAASSSVHSPARKLSTCA